MLNEESKTNKNCSPNSQLSNSLPSVVRPETRHHLIDVHGLALFLRKATRCVQCFKTGCLSMMGNMSRLQPPCVTKITIKCQICSFILQEDLKKPKSVSIDGQITPSSKETQNSSSLEEVWVEEMQKERDFPLKKKIKYSHTDDPLQVSKPQETLQESEDTSSPFNYSLKMSVLKSSTPSEVNFDQNQSDKSKCMDKSPSRKDPTNWKENDFISESFYSAKRNSILDIDNTSKRIPECNQCHQFCDENCRSNSESPVADGSNLVKSLRTIDDLSSYTKSKYLSNNVPLLMNHKENNLEDKDKTKCNSANSSCSQFSEDIKKFQQTSIVSKIIEEFEKAHYNVSPQKSNVFSTKLKNKETKNEHLNTEATNEYKSDILRKGCQYLDSITIENLNVSNINFQNDGLSSLTQLQQTKNCPELRDARIIRKLLDLTETLKEELTERKKELETGNFESNEINLNTFKIKKETEEFTSDYADKLLSNFPDISKQNSFKMNGEPELIVPDIIIKKEKIFEEMTTNDNGSEVKHFDNESNITTTDSSKFEYESGESEVEERMEGNIYSSSK